MKRRNARFFVLGLGIFVASFVFVHPAYAAGPLDWTIDKVSQFIAWVLFIAISTLGKVTAVGFDLIRQLATYNGFINASAVAKGWFVVRDVSNMFFILILLVIAFGTLFGIEKYRYNEWLRKVIIMSVLINFSKLIVGFFIDLMQVIMLTFVNAFADTLAGNFTTMVGLKKFLSLNPERTDQTVTQPAIVATLFVGLFFMTILCIVIFSYVIMFLVRIVALWVLVVLSPLAFLLASFPDTEEYASKWWSNFWKYLTIGPVLAFFLWLSLTITQGGDTSTLITNYTTKPSDATQQAFASGAQGTVAAGISDISNSDGFLSFLIAIVLLIISLNIASESGTFLGAGIAGKTKDLMGRAAVGALKAPYKSRLGQKALRFASGEIAAGIPYGKDKDGKIKSFGIPFLSNAAMKYNSNLEKEHDEQKHQEEGRMQYLKNRRLKARLANPVMGRKEVLGSATLGKVLKVFRPQETKWHQEGLIEQYDPSAMNVDNVEGMKDYLTRYAPKSYSMLSPKLKKGFNETLRMMMEKHPDFDPIKTAPRFFRTMANSGSDFDQELFGLKDWNYDNRRSEWYQQELDEKGELQRVNVRGNNEFGYGRKSDGSVDYDFDPHMAKAKGPKWSYLRDVGADTYLATQDVIRQRYGGDSDAFFGTAEHSVGVENGQFLSRENYEAARQQETERDVDIAAGRLHADDLELGRDTIQRGEEGESVYLYDNMLKEGYDKFNFHPNASGVHIEDEAEKEAFAEEARKQFIEAQSAQRARDLVEDTFLLAQLEDQLRNEDKDAAGADAIKALDPRNISAKQKESLWKRLTVNRAQVLHTELEDAGADRIGARKEVDADGAFQDNITAEADRLYRALTNASSINVINKLRVAASKEQAELHEHAHAMVDTLSNNEVDDKFNKMDPARQQQMLREYQVRYGKITSRRHLQDAKREILTDIVASDASVRKESPFALNTAERGAAFDGTRKVIRTKFQGDTKAFYASDEYKNNSKKYVSQSEYDANRKFRLTKYAISRKYNGNAKKFFKSNEYKTGGDKYMSKLDFDREHGEEQLTHDLQKTIGDSLTNQARIDIKSVPINIRQQIFDQMPKDHRDLALSFVHQQAGRGKLTDEEAMTEALSQMEAARRGGWQNGPLVFDEKTERETALVLHAASRKRVPQHRPASTGSAPTPAAPVSASTSAIATAAARRSAAIQTAPAGSSRITAPRPTIQGRVGGTPNVVINNDINAEVREVIGGMAGLGKTGMPTRQEMKKGFDQIARRLGAMEKKQGETGRNVQPLRKQVRQLRESLEMARSKDEEEAVYRHAQSMAEAYQGGKNVSGAQATYDVAYNVPDYDYDYAA